MNKIHTIFLLTFIGFVLFVAPPTGRSQSTSSSSATATTSTVPDTTWHGVFNKGSMLLGPHLGLAAFGSAPAFGANFETGITKPGEFLGSGVLGISGRLDYFGFSDVYWKYTWIAIGVFANYHFAVNGPWDPFLGLGLGYQNVSVNWVGSGQEFGGGSWGSGMYFSGNAGVRYFLSPNMAARAQLGFGITYLVLGLDFGL